MSPTYIVGSVLILGSSVSQAARFPNDVVLMLGCHVPLDVSLPHGFVAAQRAREGLLPSVGHAMPLQVNTRQELFVAQLTLEILRSVLLLSLIVQENQVGIVGSRPAFRSHTNSRVHDSFSARGHEVPLLGGNRMMVGGVRVCEVVLEVLDKEWRATRRRFIKVA